VRARGRAAELFVGDLDPRLVVALVPFGADAQSFFVVVAAISSTMVRVGLECRPRQFIEMKLNMRCSILFHFECRAGMADRDLKAGLLGQAERLFLPGTKPGSRSSRRHPR